MAALSYNKEAEIIQVLSLSRYQVDLLKIDNPYFEGKVSRIYPSELQVNKANASNTEAPFLDLNLSISNGFLSFKIYHKRDDFDFDIAICFFFFLFFFSTGTFPVLPVTVFTFLNLLDCLSM